MKRCPGCEQFKPESEFSWRWKYLGVRQNHCRGCMAKFNKASYEKKGEEERRRIYDNRDRRAQEAKQYVWDYLASSGCERCPESDPRYLEFHHRNPKEKKYNVSNMTNGRYSIQTIQIEIAKCEVLCVRCHRKATYDERGWFTR